MGYWLALHCQKHMRLHHATGDQTCVVCHKPIESGVKYVYVLCTGDCVHLSGCLSMYPRSVWIETGFKVESVQTKRRQEEELLLNIAVCEVVVEGRSIDEVAEEFDIDIETLTKEVSRHNETTMQEIPA